MTSSREEDPGPSTADPTCRAEAWMGQALRGLRRRKPLPPGTKSLPSDHPLGLAEAGGLRGHLPCEFSFHADAREESGSHPNLFINSTEEL